MDEQEESSEGRTLELEAKCKTARRLETRASAMKLECEAGRWKKELMGPFNGNPAGGWLRGQTGKWLKKRAGGCWLESRGLGGS